MFNIVLVEPEIPPNTGNIARTCAVTGAKLHLIKPLGFSIDDKHVKRAGLDYWDLVDVIVHESLEDFLNKHKNDNLFFATTKLGNVYSDVKYSKNDYILFGSETRGIDEEVLYANENRCITIPMLPTLRSLNLSNAVAIVLYEAWRQNGFFNIGEEKPN
jgi:tRNA (cytidine/uridine-2'-O-)-methyltransferase